MIHLLSEWQQAALPLSLIATAISVVSIVYSRNLGRKIENLVEKISAL
jgi:Flp pilus assembly pilin Flp